MSLRKWVTKLISAGLAAMLLAGTVPAWVLSEDSVCGAQDRACGVTYFVATNGKDSNPGTEAQPWRTIQKAADTVQFGDVVFIKQGTYYERVQPKNSGQEDLIIVYANYPGHTVTIDGTGVSVPGWGGLFDLSDTSYIRVSGLRVVNSSSSGIFADRTSHIDIWDNYTYNTYSSGIGIWASDNAIVRSNEVVLACNGGEQEAISIGGTDTFEVRYNHVHDGGPGTRGGEGIDAKDGSSNGKVYGNRVHHMSRVGIYVDAWDKHTYNIEVYGNVVYDIAAYAYAVAAEKGGLLENIWIYNNIGYHNEFIGLGVTEWDQSLSSSHPMRNIYIINNTFYDNGWVDWGGGIRIQNPEVENLVVRNNILSQNLSFQLGVLSNVPVDDLTIDHNLIDGYRGHEEEILGDNALRGSARFASTTAPYFQLQPSSPAVDAGSGTNAPSRDYAGHTRPLDGNGDGTSRVDIGAYELPLMDRSLYLPLIFDK